MAPVRRAERPELQPECRGAALAAIAEVNPTVPVIETSARSGEGVEDLLDALLGVGA